MIWVTLHRLAVGVLPIQAAVLRPLAGRISLRHHRKILIVDNDITYVAVNTALSRIFE